jgi:hypothetical protein
MTTTLGHEQQVAADEGNLEKTDALADHAEVPSASPPEPPAAAAAADEAVGPVGRPLAVSALSTAAAAMMAGGIFGSWPARITAVVGTLVGVLWTLYCVRRPKNTLLKQPFIIVVAFALGLLSLVPTSGAPAQVFSLMRKAVSSGQLLRPPVPFDPGWRPILLLLFALLGFATAWVAVGFRRPQLALVLPLPVLALAAISQPAKGQFVSGMLGFVPLLIALGLLFGGDREAVSDLGAAFEIRRAIKSAPLVVGGVVLLVVLGHTNFLFPKPVFNPVQKPQKPKSIPLGKVRDRVLFTISGPIDGPWKIGDLDTYSGNYWLLPPFDPKDNAPPSDGVVNKSGTANVTVIFKTGDLGTTSVLPGVVDPRQVKISGAKVVYDSRTGTFRIPDGRVPAGLTYQLALPTYPTAAQLQAAPSLTDHLDPSLLKVPTPPPAVQKLLAHAPTNPWLRLDYLRKSLNDVVIASGAGDPSQPVSMAKVQQMLAGDHLASPYQIVATEALLARWAGIPSRIGYGFDGFNLEHGQKTVRPKNAATWLEVYFQGHGWVPLIGNPPRAQSSLKPQNTPVTKVAVASDVAVQIYIPVEVQNLKQLYQQIRHILLEVLPFIGAGLVLYLVTPSLRRKQRRRKRRLWARRQGLREEIAVEYAEFRDAASDLNIGDVFDTPLEFLDRVAPDDELAELAWLVTRSTYGDMMLSISHDDVEAAREMAESCGRRMLRAQPLQSRVLAFLSRASLRDPYTLEVPNVWMLRLRNPRRSQLKLRHWLRIRLPRLPRAKAAN